MVYKGAFGLMISSEDLQSAIFLADQAVAQHGPSLETDLGWT